MPYSHTTAGQRQTLRKELAAGQLLTVDLVTAYPGRNPEKQLGIILNLSEGGMAVQPFRPLAPGTVADFRFMIDQSSAAPAGRGEVAWKAEGGPAGFRFNAPLPESDRLREWLNTKSPDSNSDEPALPLSALTREAGATEFQTALRLIAYNSMVSTGASGAAIALGSAQGMECAASVGSAPPLGAKLLPGMGLSGLCLRTGRVVSSNDVQSDLRVPASVAEQMDLRSLVILPILVSSRIAGLLEVFSNVPFAFSRTHFEQLQSTADLLSRAIQESKAGLVTPLEATEPVSIPEISNPEISSAEIAREREVAGVEQPVELTAPSQAMPEEAFTLTGAPIATSDVGEEAAPVKTRDSHKRLRQAPYLLAAIAVVALVVFGLWMLTRTNVKRPQNSTNQTTQQNATPAPSGQSGAGAAAGNVAPTLGFETSEITQSVGTTFSVSVILYGAKNVSSVPLQILYDPQKLQPVNVTADGSLLEKDGQNVALVHREDAKTGKIQLAISRPAASPGISGEGELLTLFFLCKAPGRSTLRLNSTELHDASSHLIAVNGSEAVVNISPNRAENNQPTETAPKQNRAATAGTPSKPAAPESQPGATKTESTPAAEAGALVINGVPPGSSVDLDGQVYTSTAQDGKVAIRNLPAGEHHVRMAIHGSQYYDQVLKVNPGQTINVETHKSLTEPVPPSEPPKPPGGAVSPTVFFPKIVGPPSFVLSRTFRGHSNWVTSVAFSANGQHLATGSWDKSVKLWDVASGKVLSTIANERGGVQALAFSRDGRWLAAEDAFDGVSVWDASTGATVRVIAGHKTVWDKTWVYSIAFSPDGRRLAVGMGDRTVRILDISTGATIRDLVGHQRPVIYAAFSPNGRWLATGEDARTIEIWDVASGKTWRTLKGHSKDVYAVAFSPDGDLLASASKDKTVKLWDLNSGREVSTLTGHQGWVTGLAFSPNSRWLATSSWDKTTKIWNVNNGRLVQTLSDHTNSIYSLAFDSHGGWLATGSEDGTVSLWRLRSDIDLAVLNEEGNGRTTASSAASAAHAN